MPKTVVKSYAAREGEKCDPDGSEGRHKNANNKMRDALSSEATMLQFKRTRHDNTQEERPILITQFWDEGMQKSVDKDRPLYYINPEGISMTYPRGSKLAKLSGLDVIREQDNNNSNSFSVVMGCKKNDPDNLTFIALKVSDTKKKIKPEKMKIYNEALKGMLKNKPSVVRGKKRNGVTATQQRYVCDGYRKDPLGTHIGRYAYNSGVSETTKREIEDGIANLIREIEKRGIEAMNTANMRACVGYTDFFRVQEEFGLPSMYKGGIATQFALSIGYCSGAHDDNDFFITHLAVYDENAEPGEILYYFCFPTYRIAVPMRSGDIIVFNPKVPHCATNPSRETAMIYSCYVSNKTVNTAAADTIDARKANATPDVNTP
jgi:hypothetical protein